jgi:Flp pilus assembly pilin Flp
VPTRFDNYISALRCSDGQTLTEYALVLALVVLGVVGALTAFGTAVGGLWSNTVSGIEALIP